MVSLAEDGTTKLWTVAVRWRKGSFLVCPLLPNSCSVRACWWCCSVSTSNPHGGRRVQAGSKVRKEHGAVGSSCPPVSPIPRIGSCLEEMEIDYLLTCLLDLASDPKHSRHRF